ncbi:MAG TPA: DUF1178 family protein [Methylocella sp.]|nr:DUF1178 family protein [Methylocella sp.]
MIKFALRCVHGHEFESWFQSGEAFEMQSKAGRVLCPFCQAPDVTKAIMAPAVTGKRAPVETKPRAQPQTPSNSNVALLDPRDLEARALLGAFRRHIFKEAEDVGTRFAEEARKIHEGLVEERPIHGQANVEEARALIEEGIDIMPIPPLPDEFN